MIGGLGGRRLSSARRNARADRPRNHCRIRPAARCARGDKKSVSAGSWARRDEALRTDDIDPTDQPLSVIATPTQVIGIKCPGAAPAGMDWTRLSAQDLEEMPILAELKRMTPSNA